MQGIASSTGERKRLCAHRRHTTTLLKCLRGQNAMVARAKLDSKRTFNNNEDELRGHALTNRNCSYHRMVAIMTPDRM